MIWISSFGRFIFASSIYVLAAENRVGLECLLAAEPIAIDVCIALSCDVEKFESRTLPEIVTTVDELVDASIEASLLADLPLAEPLGAPIQVKLVSLSQ